PIVLSLRSGIEGLLRSECAAAFGALSRKTSGYPRGRIELVRAAKRRFAARRRRRRFRRLCDGGTQPRLSAKSEDRKLAIVVLPSGQWPEADSYVAAVVAAVDCSEPGGFVDLIAPRTGSGTRWERMK